MTFPPAPGPAQDPGYVASLRSGAGQLGATRRLALVLVSWPALLWVAAPFLPLGARAMPAWSLLVVAGAIVVTMGLTRLVTETVTPLPPGMEGVAARDESLVVFRSQVVFHSVVSSTPVLTGFVLAVAAHSPAPWAAGFLLGWPLMLLSLPTTSTVERVRERLEAHGADSHLWTGLLHLPGTTTMG